METAQKGGCELVLPVDNIIVEKIEANAPSQICDDNIPAGRHGVDIGPETIKLFVKKLEGAKTIVWNGPMGVFEMAPFDAGTKAVAQAVAKATDGGGISVVGGGDSASAVKKLGLSKQISHISTGGGASLEFMEGKKFKCLEILDEK
jgi:3-phosphoglycerate kinase